LGAALGIGAEFDYKADLDLRVLAIIIRDLVFKAFHLEEKRTEQIRSVELAHAATGEKDLPSGETDASIEAKIKEAVQPPFAEYAQKKRKQGAHGVKRAELQAIVDEHVTRNYELRPFLRTDPANKALADAATTSSFLRQLLDLANSRYSRFQLRM
jgi:hypothetical protein